MSEGRCHTFPFCDESARQARRNGDTESALVEGKPPAPGDTESRLANQPIIPDYELLRRIGGGAYGEAWLARSKATGVLRAAKIVWRHTFEDDRPFQREFEGIQKFERISREHPSQLALFHIGRNDAEGYFYYVMELADGVENPKSEIRNASTQSGDLSRTSGQIGGRATSRRKFWAAGYCLAFQSASC